MTTCVASGSGNLHFRETLCRGQSCGQATWVSSVTFRGCPQNRLSGYLLVIPFLLLSDSSYEFDITASSTLFSKKKFAF